MTCYFRHLKDIFQKAGIEVTVDNGKEIDKVIHEIVKIKNKNCSVVWKEVKKHIMVDEDSFAAELKNRWAKHAKKRT